MLLAQGNLAGTYHVLGRSDHGLRAYRDVYSGYLKLLGEEHLNTLTSANNYAASLNDANRFEEAKSLLRKTIPVARRVLGEEHRATLKMRKIYAKTLYRDADATLNDLREAVKTLAETEQTARRVLGGAHPTTVIFEQNLRHVRAVLRARDGGVSAIREGVEAMAA